LSKKKKITLWTLLVLLLLGAGGAYWGWRTYLQPNVDLQGKRSEFIFVRTGWTMDELVDMLEEKQLIKDRKSFEQAAAIKKFTVPKPGRYRIEDGMSNRKLVNMLQAGLQEPVQFTFTGLRTKAELVRRVGRKLEADSSALLFMLNDNTFLSRYGFNSATVMTMFIPSTYEFYWNTSAEEFIERMAKEYKAFWTEERKAKAKAAGLTQSQVVILASIVQAEQTTYNDEKPVIAGLYINRLRKRMALQSDPTLIYAIGDFSIRRVLNSDKEIDSPYNTYKHAGLPPGPINIPEISSIEAVLNYKKSDYLYMCARYGSGRHAFTSDYNVHMANAKAYREALDKANINR